MVVQPEITKEKEDKINFVRESLKRPNLSDDNRYQIYLRLFDEYLAFRFDSAYKCIEECIDNKQKKGDVQQLQYCQLRLSHILAVTGLFNKTRELLEGIDVNRFLDVTVDSKVESMLEVYVVGMNIRGDDIPCKEQDEYIRRIETVGGGL